MGSTWRGVLEFLWRAQSYLAPEPSMLGPRGHMEEYSCSSRCPSRQSWARTSFAGKGSEGALQLTAVHAAYEGAVEGAGSLEEVSV
eukprot:2074838-Amphidinium_carterae.1